MAAERMPDFNEIDSLIGNLGKLEKSFSKITSEYDLHERMRGGTEETVRAFPG